MRIFCPSVVFMLTNQKSKKNLLLQNKMMPKDWNTRTGVRKYNDKIKATIENHSF